MLYAPSSSTVQTSMKLNSFTYDSTLDFLPSLSKKNPELMPLTAQNI